MKFETMQAKIRQPIVTVAGHVDHGKTTILDCFRDTAIQQSEAGGITQKISFTKYPLTQIKCACPLIDEHGIRLEIPGFLFIDTPGHAAFTNLRKRGGSLADLAILVVNIKEGIQPQTAEVLQILRANKTPFLVALNKLDQISGWQTNIEKQLEESIEHQSITAMQEFQEALITFQGSLVQHGFDSDLYYEVKDFTKKIAIVPCSAKTHEGIPELLFVLCGLSQKYLKEKLAITNDAKGVILEIKKEKSIEAIETILYDGTLAVDDQIAIASLNEPIIAKVRAIQEVEPLCSRYRTVKQVTAATGARLQLTNKEGVLPGMPFQRVSNNKEEIKVALKKEVTQAINLDRQGIIVKADSLGSLEALITLLKQESISIVRAGIGPIGKTDIISAKANHEINPLSAIILGFNVTLEENLEQENVKVLTNDVIYRLIEDLQSWRSQRATEIERTRILKLATICKLEVLHQFVFRNSNPAVFGVKVVTGTLKKGISLITSENQKIARVKAMQHEKASIQEAKEGQEVAISLPGVNFERKLKEITYLYADITESQLKKFKQNKDLLSKSELAALQEITQIKRSGSNG